MTAHLALHALPLAPIELNLPTWPFASGKDLRRPDPPTYHHGTGGHTGPTPAALPCAAPHCAPRPQHCTPFDLWVPGPAEASDHLPKWTGSFPEAPPREAFEVAREPHPEPRLTFPGTPCRGTLHGNFPGTPCRGPCLYFPGTPCRGPRCTSRHALPGDAFWCPCLLKAARGLPYLSWQQYSGPRVTRSWYPRDQDVDIYI